MIVADSSVWIAYFRNSPNPAAQLLEALLGVREIGVPDLVLTEVLQGADTDAQAKWILEVLSPFEVITTGGRGAAIAAASNYRNLRRRGVTVRKTIDTLIATACIRGDHILLHNDRDFEPFVEHLGLKSLT